MNRKQICDNTLAMMYETGEPISKIADYFGYSKRGIIYRAKKLGLEHPNLKQKNGRFQKVKTAIKRYTPSDPNETRLYVSERDKYGLVIKTWVYRNNSPKRELVYSAEV